MGILASVVIPTYRRSAKLQVLLDVLVEQVGQVSQPAVVEVVVVDNCPDASARTVVDAAVSARYIHEPRTGVANARNRGVIEAKGTFIIFIDDDELPLEGWLKALLDHALDNKKAFFGPIEPNYDISPPDDGLRSVLEHLFSRRLPAVDGQDISCMRAYLGTGNSMLSRQLCLSEPFEERFNDGGEDVWFLRRVVEEHGITLHWCAGAKVCELVPAGRMTPAFLRQRRFRDGQLRCIVESGRLGLRSFFCVSFWMGVGLLQIGVYGTAASLLYLARRPEAHGYAVHCVGGLGKLMWWADSRLPQLLRGNCK